MITELLIGFVGALSGGLVLVATCIALYFYEQKQKSKFADKLVSELKNALAKQNTSKIATLRKGTMLPQ